MGRMSLSFLAQVKRNARRLWENIALYTALCKPISTCEYYDDSHGREVHRRVELFENKIGMPTGWNHIERIVKVRRWGNRDQKQFHEVSFYILSKPINSAFEVAMAIQNHWSIENKPHWIKDVNLGEDQMSINNHNSVAIIAYLNNMALNTIRKAGLEPTKDTFARITNKVNQLAKMLNIST
jgi:predicted transposase YbfD/YdcC